MIEIPRHPNYSKNQQKAPADSAPCACCGKPVRNPVYWIATYQGYYAVTEAELIALDPSGDSGGFPIGADCLKKHPELKPYVVKSGGAS